ncbi:MAG TPA: hypothetical protein VH208_10535 [Myxococcaceae bacterium]|nr:hypothetical protein [Myxococcaceae bacterium]
MKIAWVSLIVAVSTIAWADESAQEIARKARERGGLNLMDLQAELKMVTTSKDGAAKEQVVTTASRKVEGRTRSILRFSQPASVSGVAVLTVEGQGGAASDR